MTVKASDRWDITSRSLFLYHIFYSFDKPFITTGRVVAELDIPVLTNWSNRNIILHDVILQLKSNFNGTSIDHGQSYPIFGFW